ncbi:hypothetical protein BC629DRAFT_616331 [Irpex lacteus]|nr:hypothetical protein BC629DRAFT_616331 [Irpex lacteus]
MCDLALYRKVVPSALRKRYRGQRNSTMSAKTSDVTNRKGWLGQKLWHSVMGFIDVKNDRFLRPFSMDTGEPHFLLSTKTARKARGQLVQCVGEIVRRQHRLFLYSVVIVPRVRLIYWDRGGALVSEPFDVQQEGAKFLSFIYALGCMSDQALGSREVVLSTPRRRLRAQDGIRAINRSGFGPFSSPEFRLRPYLIEKHRRTLGSMWNDVASLKLDADPDRWKECLEQATADDWPLYKLQVSSDNPSRAHKRWLEHISNKTTLPLSASREFLVGKQFLEGRRSPIGRGCKRFVALDVETQEFVDLKDFWHFEDPDQLPEFSIYAKLIEADVPNIPIFLCGGHISGIGQATIAHEFDQRLPKYRHGRFVVCEVTRPLETYANTHELTTVFQDALTAHRCAWENADLLHGDISDHSIVIHDGRGLLMGWGLATAKHQLPLVPAFKYRTGTWRYVSGLLCNYPLKPYEMADDLQSFIHVLTILIMRFQKHREPPDMLVYILDYYDEIKRLRPYNIYKGHICKGFIFGIGIRAWYSRPDSTSPNFNALLRQLLLLGMEHERLFSAEEVYLYAASEPNTTVVINHNCLINTMKPPTNSAYATAAAQSPFNSHEPVLGALEEALSKDYGWLEMDRGHQDFFRRLHDLQLEE